MSFWENAPITMSAFGPKAEKGPPPIAKEWRSLCKNDQDLVFLWAGEWNRCGEHLGWAWMWGYERTPNPVMMTAAASIERLLAPIAHEARARLMQIMYDGPKSAGELSAAAGLKGGNLYYHLKELIHAAYVKEVEGGYDLTPLGCQLLLTFAAIAGNVIKDRGEEGLLVAPSYDEDGPRP